MPKQHMPVTANHPVPLINQVIGMPEALITSDGREVEVTEWDVEINQGEPIRIECHGKIIDSPIEDMPMYLKDGERAFLIKSWSHRRDQPIAEQPAGSKTISIYFTSLVAVPMEMKTPPYSLGDNQPRNLQ